MLHMLGWLSSSPNRQCSSPAAAVVLVGTTGWLRGLDFERTSSMAGAEGRSNAIRVLQCKQGQASFALKVRLWQKRRSKCYQMRQKKALMRQTPQMRQWRL